ncbi:MULTISPECIES: lipid IV(A) 3-deoxy-D-manno-octulosonic acid transferase [unclassified Shewanella]|uniref:lipid IV(A) 3-deoxy-D-manno-octulosonic acid transferase n=1 Tax=unclassified Shewanella TaxID=196818 RepID=UPI001BBB233A|nr:MULTISPECIES: lipid IV(A) 3-deoxy-D-manno-octulosonic acid transferase [unclassified Shewanella]GIU14894.1 3-deoxy-D-manno-octulosonic acid transferase [Shewanella sp. MBTL60-112-B1]GIU37583.1 3-deoxy-D-manno-octulosonic acid transferase [Shewanella sp. MBTL60-112-B2]
MNRSLYSLALYLISPLLLVYLAVRAFKSKDYRGRWSERFGFKSLKQTDLLVHSVSMGETLAAIPLIKQIQQRHPELEITITTTSPTGSAEVVKAFGSSVQHCYLPFDLAWCAKRFVKQVAPKCCIIMETELWPNLIHYLKRAESQVLLANARLSQKSADSYRKHHKLTTPMLKQLDGIAAQSQQAAERFIALGVAPERVSVCGSLKFDISIDEQRINTAKALRQQWQATDKPVWVAGSVHPGEFDCLIAAHQQLLAKFPDALMVMVPRHPEQFDAAALAVKSAGLALVRRSSAAQLSAETQVVLGDTMGELLTFYAAADQAIVGGSLIVHGGHNPLEPAALGLPVMMGPNYRDFVEITELLVSAGGLKIVDSSEALANNLIYLFDDKKAYRQASEAAKSVVEQNRGSLAKQLAVVESYIQR